MKRLVGVAFSVCLLLSASAASASTILASNLHATQDSFSFQSLTYWEASSFITPNTGTYVVTAVIVPVALFSGPTDFSLQLYTDNAGIPGTSLGSFTPSGPIPPDAGLPFSFTTFSPVTPVVLLPGTTYWLGANLTTGTVLWAYNGSATQTQEGFGTVTGFFSSSFDQGASWGPPGVGPDIFQIEGTPVPEPGTLVLLGLGLVALAARRHSIRIVRL